MAYKIFFAIATILLRKDNTNGQRSNIFSYLATLFSNTNISGPPMREYPDKNLKNVKYYNHGQKICGKP